MSVLDENTVRSLLSSPLKSEPQQTITFWYGGWSLKELRQMRSDLFYDQSWYDSQPFADEKHEPGTYTVCLKVPGSNNKTLDEQKELLDKDDLCPVAIAATAYLLSFIQSGADPLNGDWTRTGSQDGGHVSLGCPLSQLCVDTPWDTGRGDGLWASSVRPNELERFS